MAPLRAFPEITYTIDDAVPLLQVQRFAGWRLLLMLPERTLLTRVFHLGENVCSSKSRAPSASSVSRGPN